MNRVDVLASLTSGQNTNRKVEVKTIMQDIVILATGMNVTNNIPRLTELEGDNIVGYRNLNGDTSFRTVTLEVSPKEAQDLVFLQVASPGGIYLILRNSIDRKNLRPPTSDINSLLGRVAKANVNSPFRSTAARRVVPRKTGN